MSSPLKLGGGTPVSAIQGLAVELLAQAVEGRLAAQKWL